MCQSQKFCLLNSRAEFVEHVRPIKKYEMGGSTQINTSQTGLFWSICDPPVYLIYVSMTSSASFQYLLRSKNELVYFKSNLAEIWHMDQF